MKALRLCINCLHYMYEVDTGARLCRRKPTDIDVVTGLRQHERRYCDTERYGGSVDPDLKGPICGIEGRFWVPCP